MTNTTTKLPRFQKVESSVIDSIGYSDGDLFIKYSSGAIYKYKDVPAKLYESCMAADSKGQFVNNTIKYRYSYFRLD